MIYEAPPVYPLLAVHSGIEGVVWVRALVGERGNVLEAAVEKSSGFPYLDDAALKAAMKCRYKSGMQQGIPVTCWVTYKVEFD
ncbi:MAG: energy transducer TonB, partial [Candidatus Zixiibacteriota bacterium]